MKRYVYAIDTTNKNYFEDKHALRDSERWYEWALGDKDEEELEELDDEELEALVKDTMEDNGYRVVDTLKEACDMIFDYCNGDIEECLGQLDIDYGNSVGVFPLVDEPDQEETFLDYCSIYHPELKSELEQFRS